MLQINYKKLIDVLCAFYRTTGARVAIYDDKKVQIASFPERNCKLCEELRKNKHINSRCKNSDKKAFETCKKTKMPYTYECDMGLFESIAPIIIDGKIVAYIMMGQVACLSSKTEILEQAKKYFSDTAAIEKIVQDINNISMEKLDSSSLLMNICLEYLFISANITIDKIDKFNQIDEYILSNIKYGIIAEDICKHFKISRTTLHYQLKKKYDMSFIQRLNYLRIEKAKAMLLEKKMIEDVCDEIGIAEKSYFFKLFKKVTGQTTREFLFDNITNYL